MHLSQIIAFKSKTLVNKLDALLHWCVHFYPRTSFFFIFEHCIERHHLA